ncbi:MAG: hypothetical protein ABJ000_03650 [Saccharospirillum sp.]|uniref:WD40/YVTN/BNR-like repeat-containing protein n=1 Tax=Saccharospirillum sp. TaxID=2033801 RepID=UPI003297A396
MLTRKMLAIPTLIALGSLLTACGDSSGGGSGGGSGGAGTDTGSGSGGSVTGIAQSGFETEASQRWNWVHPLPQNYGLQAVISDGQMFHAVGTNGTYMNSPTGDNWTVRHFPADTLAGIAWNGASTLVAVGESGLSEVEGLIAYSTNGGADWQPAELPGDPGRFSEVVWTGNNFVAVTASGDIVAISPNGISWTVSETGEMTGIGALANQGSTLVSGGSQGAYYSEDGGATWAPVAGAISANSSIRAFEYLNGQFIGIGGYQLGGFLTSSNGADWSKDDDDFNYVYQGSFADSFTFSAVTQLGDHFWVSDTDGNIHRRDLDAPNWTQPVTSSLGFIASMATRNDTLLAVGTKGRLVRALAADDIEELKKTPLGGADFTAMVQDDSYNILIGTEDGKVWFTDDDGVNWTESTVLAGGAIEDLAFSGYGFVAVGNGFMASSPDGTTWTVRDGIELPDYPGTALPFDSVAATIDGWVAIGNNNVAVCTAVDACEYLDENTPALGMSQVVHDGHNYVLVNFSGGVFRSVDGLEWSRMYTADDNLSSIAASAEAMVISAANFDVQNKVYVSNDLGVTWEPAQFGEGADIPSAALSVSDNTFYLYSAQTFTLWTSTDGLNWEPEYAPLPVFDVAEVSSGQMIRGSLNRLFERLVVEE